MNLRHSLASSAAALTVALVAAQGCSSSTPGTSGAVSGAQDSHCGSTKQAVDVAACLGGGDAGVTTASRVVVLHEGHDEDAGDASADGGTTPDEPYGATMYNAAGNDDECKYTVSFTSTEVGLDKDVTFTLKLASIVDGKPMAGAEPYMENFLGDHIGPATTQTANETATGTYTIGPVRFDKSGQWTVRFHFYGQCDEDESATSPHGHAAFYFNVP
jgi:hypothetical protein